MNLIISLDSLKRNHAFNNTARRYDLYSVCDQFRPQNPSSSQRAFGSSAFFGVRMIDVIFIT